MNKGHSWVKTRRPSLCNMYIRNTSVPQYLSQRINRRVNARTLRSSATPLLIQPLARTDFAKVLFDVLRRLSGTHFPRLSSKATHCLYSNLG